MLHPDDLRDLLLARILTGEVTSADKLDDRVIGREYGVSRTAVRGALGALSENGVLARARRVGTSPAYDRAAYVVGDTATFSGTLAGSTRFRTLSMTKEPAPEALAADLGVAPGDLLDLVRRSTVVNGDVLGHWTIWSPLLLRERYRDRGLPEDLTWYEVAGAVTGTSEFLIDRRTTVLRAATADHELLDVEPGAPVMFVSRVTRTRDGRAVDRSFGRWCADRVVTTERLQVTIDRPSGRRQAPPVPEEPRPTPQETEGPSPDVS